MVLLALRLIPAEDPQRRNAAFRRGLEWMLTFQCKDGGWGTFDDPHRPSVRRGIDYLIRNQNPDGSWSEEATTGTGFPKVYYRKYDMYRNTWPLLALATYQQLLRGEQPGTVANR